MAITAGETLSLNGLAAATGQGVKSLSAAKGNTTGPIAMSSFGIDEVGTLTGFTYIVENTGDTYTLAFTGAGANFSRISTQSANFTWSVPVGTTIGVVNSGAASTVTAVNDIGGAAQTVRSVVGNQTNTLRVNFADGFNDHATNYNTNIDKTVYAVDSYDGNATPLCLTLDTPITKADGTIIAAGDLEEGDVLKGYSIETLGDDSDGTYLEWSTDTLTKTEENVTVTNVIYSFSSRIYNINSGELSTTSEHPFLVKSNGTYQFKPAMGMVVGDLLIKGDGTEVEVISIEIIEGDVEVVAIDVEVQDTYLANGYITHNKGANSYTDYVPAAVTGLSYTDPNLSWTNVVDYEDYRVQVDNDSNFSSPIIDYSNWNSNVIQVRLGAAPFNLTDGATYYARVAGRDAGVLGSWSTTLTFTA
jgi:hypothetical protein